MPSGFLNEELLERQAREEAERLKEERKIQNPLYAALVAVANTDTGEETTPIEQQEPQIPAQATFADVLNAAREKLDNSPPPSPIDTSKVQLPQMPDTTVPQQPAPTPFDAKLAEDREPTTEKISRLTMEGALRGGNQPYQLQQGDTTAPPNALQIDKAGTPPNTLYQEIVRNLAQSRLLAETAPQGEKGDAQRAQAARMEQEIRDYADAIGIDISRFGAENTSAGDIYRNIAAQRGYDLNEAFNGRYSQRPDDFYQERYRWNSLGASPTEKAYGIISKFFGFDEPDAIAMQTQDETRQYQAKRAAFLDGLMNAYGLDGTAGMNHVGHQLAALMEPQQANLYLNRFQNADTRYRENEDKDRLFTEKFINKAVGQTYDLQKLSAQQLNSIALLLLGGQIDEAKLLLQSGLNEHYAGYTHALERINSDYEHVRLMERELFKNDLEMSKFLQQEQAKGAINKKQLVQKAAEFDALMKLFQPKDTREAGLLYATLMGYKVDEFVKQYGKRGEGLFSPETVKQLQASYSFLQEQIAGIDEALLSEDLPKAERDKLEAQKRQMSSMQNNVQSLLAKSFGEEEIPAYGKDENANLQTAYAIVQRAGAYATSEDIVKNIHWWMKQSDPSITEEQARIWCRDKLKIDTVKEKPQPKQTKKTVSVGGEVHKDAFGDTRPTTWGAGTYSSLDDAGKLPWERRN